MKKWIVLGAIVAVLVLAIVVAALNLEAWLDENRPMIEAQAGSAVGREITLGDLGVQIWGGLGVSVEGIRVAEDPAYGDGAFLTLEHAVVRISVLPAIFGRIELGEIVLEQPRLRVIRDAKGYSFESMMGASDPEAPADEEAGAAPALLVSSFRLEQGQLVFEDRTGEEVVESVIDGIDLFAEDVGAERPLRFELAARLLGADVPNLTGEGTAGPVLAPAGTPMAFDVTFRLEDLSLEDVLKLEDVAATVPPEATLRGDLDATLAASGVPEDVRFDVSLDAVDLDLAYGETFVKPAGVPFGFTARGRALAERATVERFDFVLADTSFEGEASAALDESGAYDATIRGDGVPLAGWGDLLPALAGMPVEGALGLDVRARGSSASEQLPGLEGAVTLLGVAVRLADTPPVEQLDATLRLKGRAAELRETRFEVGGAPMQLEADIADLNAPDVRFALDAPELPLAALGVAEPGTEADDVLRRLRVVGRADVAGEALVADARFASPEGRLQGLDYRSLEGRASLDGERMRLDEMKVQLLGGEVRLAGALDSTEAEAPRFDGRLDVAGVRIEEFVRARFPLAGDVLSGRIDTGLSLSGQSFDDTDALLRSLSGVGRIGIQDGVIYDVNVAEEVLKSATGIPGLSSWISPSVKQRHPALFASGDTRFRRVRGAVEVVEGLLRTDDFELESDDFGLTGGGTIGLDGSLSFQTEFKSSADLATSLVGVARPTRFLLDRGGRLVVPVRIGGTLTDPQVRPDSQFLSEAIAKAAVGTATTAITDLLGGRSRDEKEETTEEPTTSPSEAGDGEPEPSRRSPTDELQKQLEGLF